MGKKIAIIGGGASCIAFIESFVNECNKESSENLHLMVFEKLPEIGPGNAYQTDAKSNLLNTKAGYITALKDRPGDFFNWLAHNQDKWKPEYPGLEISEDSYAPRPLFGMYMQDTFNAVVAKAREADINVDVIQDEVVNLKENYDAETVLVSTISGAEYEVNKSVIACGTSLLSPDALIDHDQVYHSPYPVDNINNNIPKDADVSIVGARLSAIDAVIGLIENGHKGEITLYSRSGLFPSVRGVQGRYKNKYLALDFINRNYPDINMTDLSELFFKEMENYRATNPDNMEEELVFPPPMITDFEKFLSYEIDMAQHKRGWQAVLYDTNSLLADVWGMLPEGEKDWFMSKMLASAMSMRVSIPVENAIKMLEYVKSGQLKFVTGNSDIEKEGDQLFVTTSDGEKHPTGAVIYATGSPRDANMCDSPLLRNLLSDGLVRQHPFGGVDVCERYHNIVDNTGNFSNTIYAVGEITNGKFLFTSAMDIIVRHAHKCATVLHKHITHGIKRDLVA